MADLRAYGLEYARRRLEQIYADIDGMNVALENAVFELWPNDYVMALRALTENTMTLTMLVYSCIPALTSQPKSVPTAIQVIKQTLLANQAMLKAPQVHYHTERQIRFRNLLSIKLKMGAEAEQKADQLLEALKMYTYQKFSYLTDSQIWSDHGFTQCYMLKAALLEMYLDPDSPIYSKNKTKHAEVIEKFRNLSATEFVALSENELVESEKNHDLESRKHIAVELAFCTLYKCPKCKVSKCTLRDVQRGRIDEASNVVAECLECHYKWQPA